MSGTRLAHKCRYVRLVDGVVPGEGGSLAGAQMEIVKRKPFGETNDLGDQNRFGGLNSQAKAVIFISFEH